MQRLAARLERWLAALIGVAAAAASSQPGGAAIRQPGAAAISQPVAAAAAVISPPGAAANSEPEAEVRESGADFLGARATLQGETGWCQSYAADDATTYATTTHAKGSCANTDGAQ